MLKVLPALVEKLKDYKKHFKNNVELNENIEVRRFIFRLRASNILSRFTGTPLVHDDTLQPSRLIDRSIF